MANLYSLLKRRKVKSLFSVYSCRYASMGLVLGGKTAPFSKSQVKKVYKGVMLRK